VNNGVLAMEGARVERARIGCRLNSALWALLLLIGLFALFALVPLSAKARLQFAIAPLLVFFIYRLRLFEVRIPRSVLFATGLGITLGAVINFYHVNLTSGAFLVSTVSDQDLQQETKIYRDRLRRSIQEGGDSLVGVYPVIIRDGVSARSAVEKNRALAGIIWGSSRWMSAALRHYEPLALSSFPHDSIAQSVLAEHGLQELLIYRFVPAIGMSHGHERGTIHFLGEVIRSWRVVPEVLVIGADSGDFEGRLEALAKMQARWTSRSHLAFPLWLSATAHLIRATEGAALQEAELKCALTQFKEALGLFRTRDNPALQMAVRNNYAIALLVQTQIDKKPRKVFNQARRQLAAAARLRKLESRGVGSIAALNHLALAQAGKRRALYGRK